MPSTLIAVNTSRIAPNLVLVLILVLNIAWAQCNLSVQSTATDAQCLFAVQETRWTNTVNLSVSGTEIIKNAGGNGAYNAGAFSTISLSHFGSVYHIPQQTNDRYDLGLSATDGGAGNGSIEFAFSFNDNGTVRIRESGTEVAFIGSYTTSDTFQLQVYENTLFYLRNGSVVYQSTRTPTYPLFADVSIRDEGATIASVFFRQPADGNFTATEDNPGAAPTYTWLKNGATAATGASFADPALAPGDSLFVVLTPGAGGCAVSNDTSEIITFEQGRQDEFLQLAVQSDAANAACLVSIADITWVNQVGMFVDGNAITKIQGGNGAYNAGASSLDSIYNQGFVYYIVDQTNERIYLGMSDDDVNAGAGSIDFAFDLNNNGTFQLYESGAQVRGADNYSAGDSLTIAVEDSVVRYYQNDRLIFTSSTTPQLPLIADVSFRDENATVAQSGTGNITTGSFYSQTENTGPDPDFQWFENGNPIAGATNDTLIFNAIQPEDQIYLEITPDLYGCINPYRSNTITSYEEVLNNGISFVAVNDAVAAACIKAIEQVTWTDLVNVRIEDYNSLTKIQGGNGNFNAGAATLNTVADNGFAYFIVSNTNERFYFGLSTDNPNANAGSIDYAFFFNDNGTFRLNENGTEVRGADNYSAGDSITIAVEDTVVNYYRNSTLIYSSLVTPTLPLRVDVSIRDEGTSLSEVFVVNGNAGDFTANVMNAGPGPAFQWILNGTNTGITTSDYSNPALLADDTLIVELTPDIAGCNAVVYTSNPVSLLPVESIDFGAFYAFNDPSASACIQAFEQVTWTDLVNVRIEDDNSLTKIQGGNGNFNAGAATLNTVADNGFAYFIVSNTNERFYFGLSTDNPNANAGSIDYAFFFNNNGTFFLNENGTEVRGADNYSAGDSITIAVEDTVVNYYRNSTLIYSSLVTPTLPLRVDVSIRDEGTSLSEVFVVNGNTGNNAVFVENAGPSPSYEWFLNGATTGVTTETYVNAALSDGDTITVRITPDLNGCATVSYESNPVIINEIPQLNFGAFYAFNDPSASACIQAFEQVTWTDLVNVRIEDDNSLTKIQGGNGNFNAGAATLNTVADNGFAYFIVSNTNERFYFGLSTDNPNANAGSIDYAFFFNDNGTFRLNENGTEVRGADNYSAGDSITIAVEDTVVNYYRNSTLIYSSLVTPTLPLRVDVSIRDEGTSLSEVFVVNGNMGNNAVFVENAGPSPSYEWFLNSATTGVTTETYVNAALGDGDTITVRITPDLDGCATVSYESNPVFITASNIFNTKPGFYVQSIADVTGNNNLIAFNQVVWDDRQNVAIQNNGSIEKISGGSGDFNAGAASFNRVENFSYAMTVINALNERKAFGISTEKTGYGSNNIDYYFRFEGGGNNIRIYEGAAQQLQFNTSAVGDTLKVGIFNDTIKFYINSTLLFNTEEVADTSYLVDVSIRDQGASLENLFIVNITTGDFELILADAGDSPVIDWTLNMTSTGVGTTTYFNDAITNGDVIGLQLQPDLSGCSSSTFASNTILISNPDVPLPVELSFFTGSQQENVVRMDWETYSEINNSHFEIYHATDGRNWNLIGTVEGNGTRNVPGSYHFAHRNPVMGANYYRLKQVDYDGAFEYFRPVLVFFDGTTGKLSVYPNPASGEYLYFDRLVQQVTVFDTRGMKIGQYSEISQINISGWQSGVYHLVFHDSEKQFSRMLLVP